MLKQWKNAVENFVEENETMITALLLCIAVIIVAIALFGNSKHKAWCMVYIVC